MTKTKSTNSDDAEKSQKPKRNSVVQNELRKVSNIQVDRALKQDLDQLVSKEIYNARKMKKTGDSKALGPVVGTPIFDSRGACCVETYYNVLDYRFSLFQNEEICPVTTLTGKQIRLIWTSWKKIRNARLSLASMDSLNKEIFNHIKETCPEINRLIAGNMKFRKLTNIGAALFIPSSKKRASEQDADLISQKRLIKHLKELGIYIERLVMSLVEIEATELCVRKIIVSHRDSGQLGTQEYIRPFQEQFLEFLRKKLDGQMDIRNIIVSWKILLRYIEDDEREIVTEGATAGDTPVVRLTPARKASINEVNPKKKMKKGLCCFC